MHEELRELLCPEIALTDIMKRCDLIKEQLQRPIDVFVEECTPKYKVFSCECGNTDERMCHNDELQGILVCMLCGLVLQTSLFYKESPSSTIECESSELFSPQAQYMSQWRKSNKYSRLNLAVERDLVKFGRDDTLTSDMYKDEQRKEVYALLDQVSILTNIDQTVIEHTKVMFHCFRARMYRIHKLHMAVCCLLYLNL